MNHLKLITILISFFFFNVTLAQKKEEKNKIFISGKIVDKINNIPLEYATIAFKNIDNPKIVFGGITNNKGEFNVEIVEGNYNVVAEFISFKPNELKNQNLTKNTNLGTFVLDDESTKLDEIVVRNEKTTIDIKLDKKVYNVGKDLMVKGGTVSDVLDNIPSVAVDVEGNISLRGNESVKVLIDGRPSNAINVTEALRLIPADAIDKVEVITNPSARYDAEGGGGILNIILKKGKSNGLNGTIIATTGVPDNHGLSGTINYKTENFNLFTTQGYNYRNNPGEAHFKSKYLNDDNSLSSYITEDRETNRYSKGYNGTFGFDWFLDNSLTWTNIVNYRRNTGNTDEDVSSNYFDNNYQYLYNRLRNSDGKSKTENIEFNTNFTKNFKKQGHKLTIDGSFSFNKDKDDTFINDILSNSSVVNNDKTKVYQNQTRNLIQADYVLPVKNDSQFEAGYRGSFLKNTNDYAVTNDGVINSDFTNFLEYIENVNAVYTQFGTKFNKLSMLYGLRFEDSDIEINQLTTNIFKNKKYNNFFPSAFFTYEINKETNVSLNYSKRINRPRGREINPFNNYSSSINIFRGNPDLDPSLTDAFDLGFLKKWEKLTLSTSAYYNITRNSSQMVRYIEGVNTSGTPITTTTFINIANEFRTGFEFTLNYSPYKWWKLNSNLNLYESRTEGVFNYSYKDQNNTIINKSQNLNNKAFIWSTKLNSKITLPQKIDWQTNVTYNGPQNNAVTKVKGIFAMNLAFSKDILKDKATVALNVNDVFNSRKRRMLTYIDGEIDTENMMQWRKRQVTLSFTYRFNKQKNEKEKSPKRDNDDGGGEF